MTTVLITSRVAGYDVWRPECDRALAADWTSPIRAHRVGRGQDDPNLVIVEQGFDSREVAEAFASSSTLREAMGRAGVDASAVQINFLDEVAAGTR